MPPKKAIPDDVYVIASFVWDDNDSGGGIQPVEVYTTWATANAAAKEMMIRYDNTLGQHGFVEEYELKHEQSGEGLYRGLLKHGRGGHVAAEIKVFKSVLSNAASEKTSAVKRTKAVKAEVKEEEIDDDAVEEEEEEAEPPKKPTKKGPPRTAINVQTHRKKIPQGLPDCLEGLKILFTGTFETMDRKTSIATAITCEYHKSVKSSLFSQDITCW